VLASVLLVSVALEVLPAWCPVSDPKERTPQITPPTHTTHTPAVLLAPVLLAEGEQRGEEADLGS
jgi:hypothetical protein